MRGKVALAWIFGLAGLGALGLMLSVKNGGEPLPVIETLPDFHLSDQNSQPFGLAEMKGKAAIVDFFFTHCKGPCPMMAVEMGKLQKRFADIEAIRLISISVDPANDSSQVLTEYAQAVGAQPGKWIFLTGPGDSIVKLSEQGFKLAASTWPVGHSTKFTLVDKTGRIRGYYDSGDDKAMKDLTDDVGRLLRSREG